MKLPRLFSACLFCLLLPLGLLRADVPAPKPLLVYAGTYTREDSRGIYVFRFDPATGALTPRGLAAEIDNPTYVTLHPNGQVLYAIGESGKFKGKPGGIVAAYAINPATGKLTLINQQSNHDVTPCYVSVDATHQCLLAPCYVSGSIATFPLKEDGSIGPIVTFIQHTGTGANMNRQSGPHAHETVPDPTNRLVFVPDLGLDKVMIYRLDPAKAVLTPSSPSLIQLAPGSGPRHIVFSQDGHAMYLISEIASTVTMFVYDARQGVLMEQQTLSTLPGDFKETNTAAEIAIHPNGKFLYASNRGHDSIAIFGIDPANGHLTLNDIVPSGGKTPRMFALTSDGAWMIVANQDSNSLVVFRVDPDTGRLTQTGRPAPVSLPTCVALAPAAPASAATAPVAPPPAEPAQAPGSEQ